MDAGTKPTLVWRCTENLGQCVDALDCDVMCFIAMEGEGVHTASIRVHRDHKLEVGGDYILIIAPAD